MYGKCVDLNIVCFRVEVDGGTTTRGVDVCMRCIYILDSLPVVVGGGCRGAKVIFHISSMSSLIWCFLRKKVVKCPLSLYRMTL